MGLEDQKGSEQIGEKKQGKIDCQGISIEPQDWLSWDFLSNIKVGFYQVGPFHWTSQGWKVHQMDVKNNFFHWDILDEIYMEQLCGFLHNSSLVCQLKNSLYGLKQAPREW